MISCHGPLGISLGSIGCAGGRGFVFCANGAPADIVSYVNIYANPTHCLSHLYMHPIDPFKGMVKWFWGNADSCPLEEKARFNGQLVPVSQEMSDNLGDLLPAIGPISKG